ncbi:MAG: hypothetical protein DPW14_14730 [Planctomycetes bacterium]|nr:hypothetical protein [Planctomycetota bacterium]
MACTSRPYFNGLPVKRRVTRGVGERPKKDAAASLHEFERGSDFVVRTTTAWAPGTTANY